MLATIPALDTLHTAPIEVRRFLVQTLLDFAAAHPEADGVFPFRPSNDYDDGSGTTGAMRSARVVLGLDTTTGNEPERRQWLTNAHDVHIGLRSLHAAVNEGRFSIAAPTPALADDSARDAQAKALATMRRRESMALADRANADQRIRDLEAALAAAQAPQVERASVAWGPSHPDWRPFWLQAARDAEKAGNCGEYDRHADEMGAPTRDEFRRAGEDLNPIPSYLHTVDVTLPVTFTVHVTTSGRDSTPDSYAVLSALRDQDGDDSSAIENAVANATWRSISFETIDTDLDEDSEDDSPVWVNPER